MAESKLLTFALLGGAAYVVYQWYTSQAAAAVVPAPAAGTGTGSGSTGGAGSGVAYVPPSVTQQLQTAAGANVTALNADQWAYYWTQIGKPAIDGTIFNGLFFPAGRPTDATQAPTMSAAAFVASLGTKGLAGYGSGRRLLPVPRVLVRNRGFSGGKYTLADLRRAGGRFA